MARCTASISLRTTLSAAVCDTDGSPGPKLVAGMPCSAKNATSVQPSLARRARPATATSRANRGWPRSGGAAGAASISSTWSPSSASRAGAIRSRDRRLRLLRRAIGSETMVERQSGRVGHHVAGYTAAHRDRLQRLPVLAAVNHWCTALERRDSFEQRGQSVDGIDPHPGSSGVGPFTAQDDVQFDHALASGLHRRAGGLTQDGGVARQQVGPELEQAGQPVVLSGHFLAAVQDVGQIDRGVGHGRGQLEHHRQARFHVGRPQAPQRVTVDPRPMVAVGGHRVEVSGPHQSQPAAERGAGDNVVLDPLHLQPRRLAQPAFDVVGQWRLVVAD